MVKRSPTLIIKNLFNKILFSRKTPCIVATISILITGYYSLSFFGGALVGYGDVSQLHVKLSAILPCSLLGLFIGVLNPKKWYYASLLGSIPPTLLFLIMYYGIFHGNARVLLDQLHWLQLPIEMIGGLNLLAFIGSKIVKRFITVCVVPLLR